MSNVSSWLSPALLGAAIAGGALWLAWKKLKLDLFDKRYAVYQEIGVQTMARLREVGAAQPPNMPHDDAMKAFWTAGKQVKFLFDPEAEKAYQALDDALTEYLMAWTDVRFAASPADRAVASSRYTAAHLAVPKALDAFHSACAPALRQYSPQWHAIKARTRRIYICFRTRFRKSK